MNLKKFVFMILLLFTLVILNTISTSADGCVMIKLPDERWHVNQISSQTALIDYENGYENLIILTNTNFYKSKEALWIFPVPSKPEKIRIDIFEEGTLRRIFPSEGTSFKHFVGDTLREMWDIPFILELYPLPLVLVLSGKFGFFSSVEHVKLKDETKVEIYSTVKKEYLTVQVVTAKNGDLLYNYMLKKGLTPPSKLKKILNEYIDKDYSFIISWVNTTDLGAEKFEDKTLGISVSFPTRAIYYPLRVTSIYGKVFIPIKIYVNGFVSPKIYPRIRNSTETEYYYKFYREESKSGIMSLFDMIKQAHSGEHYTKIEISARSKDLVNDLWIKRHPPVGVFLIKLFFMNGISITIWVMLISCLASLIASEIVFRKYKRSRLKFFLLGLFNLLTFMGFTAATYFLHVDRKFIFKDKNFGTDEVKGTKRKSKKEKSKFFKVFKAIFLSIILLFVIYNMLMIPYILKDIYSSENYYEDNTGWDREELQDEWEGILFHLGTLNLLFLLLLIPLIPLIRFLVLIYLRDKKTFFFTLIFSLIFILLFITLMLPLIITYPPSPTVSSLVYSALVTTTPEECRDMETQKLKDSCYQRVALQEGNENYCTYISDQLRRFTCYQKLAKMKNDYKICDLIENATHRTACYSNYAESTGDDSACGKIPYKSGRDDCYKNVAIRYGDISVCNKIEDNDIKDYCYLKANNSEIPT